MLPAERRELIQKIIVSEKTITFQELLSKVDASHSTLYRDLLQFEKIGMVSIKNGLISLTHISKTNYLIPNETAIPAPSNYAQQKSIADVAVKMISDMDSIFIGEGLLCLLLAKNIRKQDRLKNITVVTNNFSVALELENFIAHVYLLVGDLLQNTENLYTGGPRIESNLSTIFVSKAFACVDGIDFQSGYTMHELSQLSMLSHLPDFSAQTIFLIPSSQFGYNSIHQLAPVHFSDKIITDHLLDKKYRSAFSSLKKPELVIASSGCPATKKAP